MIRLTLNSEDTDFLVLCLQGKYSMSSEVAAKKWIIDHTEHVYHKEAEMSAEQYQEWIKKEGGG